MGRTVSELEEALSADEWAEWIAFNQLEPFGRPAEDDYWRTYLHLFWRAHSTNPNAEAPDFIIRDYEEYQRRKKAAHASLSLDDQIRAVMMRYVKPDEPAVSAVAD